MTTFRYALSIKQPWAGLMISGQKTIEVRKWQTLIRGPILIHAARIPDDRPEAWQWVTEESQPFTELRGGIIGIADLKSCVSYLTQEQYQEDTEHHLNDPSWFVPGLFGLVFENIESVPFRKFRGNIRFFPVPMENTDSGEREESV